MATVAAAPKSRQAAAAGRSPGFNHLTHERSRFIWTLFLSPAAEKSPAQFKHWRGRVKVLLALRAARLRNILRTVSEWGDAPFLWQQNGAYAV
jgi:hypothetical protein